MEIDDGVYAGVFVVTEVKKSILQQSLFHLCALDKDEFWIRLRRNNKSGKAFRPLRRVVRVNFGSNKNGKGTNPDNNNTTNSSSHNNNYGKASASPNSRPVSTADNHMDADELEAAEYANILNEFADDDDN